MAHQDLKAADLVGDAPKLNIEETKAPGPRNLPPGHPESPGHPSKQPPKK